MQLQQQRLPLENLCWKFCKKLCLYIGEILFLLLISCWQGLRTLEFECTVHAEGFKRVCRHACNSVWIRMEKQFKTKLFEDDDSNYEADESNDDLRTSAVGGPTRLKPKTRGCAKPKKTGKVYPCPESPDVPPIKSIPFNLDDGDTAPATTATETDPAISDTPSNGNEEYSGNVYDACLLDLPLVHNIIKPDRFWVRRKTVVRKPHVTQEAGDSVNPVTALCHQLDTLTCNSNNEKKRKRSTRLYKMNKHIIAQTPVNLEGDVEVTRPVSSPLMKTVNIHLFEHVCKLAVWMNSMKDIDSKSQIVERWDRFRNQNRPPSPANILPVDSVQISKLLGITEDMVQTFDLFCNSDVINVIRRAQYSIAVVPDLLKLVAFSFWQHGDTTRCSRYLSESHGTYLKSDIVDKYLGNMISEEEKRIENDNAKGPTLEKKKKSVKKHVDAKEVLYRNRMKDLKDLSDASTPDFGKKIRDLLYSSNPDWTVVQITSIFNHQNRFYTDAVGPQETPALYLTCLATPYEGRECASFTTYVPEPVKNPAVSKSTLMDQFAHLMVENRLINSRTFERRQYWETRADHNQKLMTILAAIEENWLFPWAFLLGGNLVNKDLRSQISRTIQRIEQELKKKLTSAQKVLLTKLIGNFKILPEIVKNSLGYLISYILDANMRPVSRIANWIFQLGSSIPLESKRHPTVLVLDQEIENIPWEWMKCVQGTSATRIQSLPLLYTSMKLVERKPHLDPKKCFYVLNPDQSLVNVQMRLKTYFDSRRDWKGVAGEMPGQKTVDDALQKDDIYLYCGHGTGQTCYPDHALQKIICNAVPLLMGCASAQYKYTGSKTYPQSVLNAYTIAMCPSVVGFLWEVTDVECDRVTVELLERWVPAPKGTQLPEMQSFDTKTERPKTRCLATAVRLSRTAATQFMTEAAIVNYGLPVYVQNG